MKESLSRFTDVVRRSPQASIAVAAAVLLVATAMVSADSWSPYVRSWVFGAVEKKGEDKQEKKKRGPSDSIRISEQAKRNIGLEVGDVKLTSFARTINLPAMVVKLTGRTHLVITAPLSGVITSVVVVGEQYVSSGAALFRIKLSHEDLVRLQTDYLRTLGQLDAERKEITRLKKVAGAGVAEQILLKREYERDTLQTVQRAQEEALRLNGLTGKQVRSIKMNRRLVREVVVRVPWQHEDFSIHYDLEGDRDGEKQRVPKQSHDIMPRNFVVEKLAVHVGESIKAGKTLCILADYQELHIAGRAFEHDAKAIVDVANARPRRTVTAMTDAADGTQKEITGLSIVHIENQIDVVSRALHFHAALPNRIVSNIERGGRRYVTWKYRPGQRMQLRVPVEIFNNVIVLPVDAVAQEGPEFYVFVENGKEFKKQPVAVKYRDQFEVVIEHDGSIFPPQRIALNGAHQLLMAIKNQAGGGADPHAGHNH